MRGERKVRLGSFGVVGEPATHAREVRRMNLVLDASKALGDLAVREHPATLGVVLRRGEKTFTLQAKGAELRILKVLAGAPKT